MADEKQSDLDDLIGGLLSHDNIENFYKKQ